MATLVPAASGPVLHAVQYGFFDHKRPEHYPFDWEITSLIVQTEAFLQLALREELRDHTITVKTVHISWTYDGKEERPFQLSFVLHAKGKEDWVSQNVILHSMEKLKFEPYITDFIWKGEAPKGKESMFTGVNFVSLESAQNMEVPHGMLPDGVSKGVPSKPTEVKEPTAEPVEEPDQIVEESEHKSESEPGPEPEPKPEVEKVKPSEAKEDLLFGDIYELEKELGRGAFSVVKLGRHKETKSPFAIKMIIKAEMQEFDKKSLDSEIAVLKKLPHHPNIIKLHDVFDEIDYIHLILEKVDGGELLDRLIQKSQYTEKEARDVSAIVMEAIRHCHEHKIAHRDLKPENLLLTSATDDSSIKVADFGFAKECPGPESLKTQCGSAQHVAPEILNNVAYGTAVDCWAIGVILFTLVGGVPPFWESTNQGTFRNIMNGEYNFDEQFWGHISEDCKDVIRNLLVQNPQHRLSCEDALKSKWVRSDGRELSQTSLRPNQLRLTEFRAKQKLKAAVFAVIGMNRLHNIAEAE